MSLLGRAFLGIWHNVDVEWRDEYDAWHTREHMPERLGIPGFLRGRRFLDYSISPHVCFTLYEGNHSETFRSPGYLARLNSPTAWSLQVQPHMPDFVRGAFVPLVSLGEGVGGAIATYRVKTGDGDAKALGRALIARAHELLDMPGVCGVHVGQAIDAASAPTEESKLRGDIDKRTDDFVVLVEGIATKDLVKLDERARELVGSAGAVHVTGDVYPLAYSLTSAG
jgi:hypothetical protein